MPTTRIPRIISEFNDYIINTDNYQVLVVPPRGIANGQYLGLTAPQAADWTARRTFWQGTLYPKYIDPGQSTPIVKSDVKQFMTDFAAFANPLLDIMAASLLAENEDELEFNFKKKSSRQDPVHHTLPISAPMFGFMQPEGGGVVKVFCREVSDGGRSSLPATADSVRIAYKLNDPAPTTPDDGCTKEIRTQAQFLFNTGLGNEAKRFHAFVQWYNTKHPDLGGVWVRIQSIIIL